MGKQGVKKSVMEQMTSGIVSVQKMQKHREALLMDGIVATAPVVMLAGPFGSGVGELAKKLALRVKVPLYGPRQLESLASQEKPANIRPEMEETESDFFDYWLGHLRQDAGLSAEERRIQLSNTIRKIATHGGVIAGVCSHMILPGDHLLRVKVEASTPYCYRRLAETRHIDEAEAQRLFLLLEEERRQLLHPSLEESSMPPIQHDLVLKAEETTMDKMLSACLNAMDQKGMTDKGKMIRLVSALIHQ